MRIVIGVLLLGHAVAHLPGFLVNLRLRSFRELPYRTTVLNGAFELGELRTDGPCRLVEPANVIHGIAMFTSSAGSNAHKRRDCGNTGA